MESKNYYRVILGQSSVYADKCRSEGFIGLYYGMDMDLSKSLYDNWRDFNAEYIPVFIQKNPGKSKIAAGLACGAIHTLCKGIDDKSIVLSPDGSGSYYIGEVSGEYYYRAGDILPHRRNVRWYDKVIARTDMSEEMRRSTSSTQPVINITKYAKEIDLLTEGYRPPTIVATDETIEDPSIFAMENHLEDFIVSNWEQTELAKNYEIVSEEGELVGKQFQTQAGIIDILAQSKDKGELLVIELKRGRATDVVVGQIQRYMGFISEELAEPNQAVKGIIIALEDDQKLNWALKATQNIEFLKYKVSFSLERTVGKAS